MQCTVVKVGRECKTRNPQRGTVDVTPPAYDADVSASDLIVDCEGARHHVTAIGGFVALADHDAEVLDIAEAFGGGTCPCMRVADAVSEFSLEHFDGDTTLAVQTLAAAQHLNRIFDTTDPAWIDRQIKTIASMLTSKTPWSAQDVHDGYIAAADWSDIDADEARRWARVGVFRPDLARQWDEALGYGSHITAWTSWNGNIAPHEAQLWIAAGFAGPNQPYEQRQRGNVTPGDARDAARRRYLSHQLLRNIRWVMPCYLMSMVVLVVLAATAPQMVPFGGSFGLIPILGLALVSTTWTAICLVAMRKYPPLDEEFYLPTCA